jgi:hypothetical protein
MIHSVDAVVVATVEATRAGRAVPTRASALPFTLVDLRVQRAVRGELGSSLTVEQTGGDTRGRTVYIDGDGGPAVASQLHGRGLEEALSLIAAAR